MRHIRLNPYKDDIADIEIFLNPESCVSTNSDDSFESECMICTGIKIEPLKCIVCHKSFCIQCLGDWATKKRSCPHCQADFVGTKLDEKEQMMLNELEFTCPKKCEKGNDRMKYHEMLNHLSVECSEQLFMCPQRCNRSDKYRPQDAINHLIYDCPKSNVTCSECGDLVMRFLARKHICESNDMRARLKEILHYLENGLDQKEITLKCPKNHPIVKGAQIPEYYKRLGGVACDLCASPAIQYDPYICRCEFDCDYDVCLLCAFKE